MMAALNSGSRVRELVRKIAFLEIVAAKSNENNFTDKNLISEKGRRWGGGGREQVSRKMSVTGQRYITLLPVAINF
jgi:hypothetical protein